jgi:hypothetical protein
MWSKCGRLSGAAFALLMIVAGPLAAQSSSNPCLGNDGRAPQLRPRDEAAKRPDLVELRRALRNAVTHRDVDAVVKILDPNVKASFGGDEGVEDFKRFYFGGNGGGVDFWKELAEALSLGGTFMAPETFATPYVYSAWPEVLDAFDCIAVVGTSVRVRAAPRVSAPPIARLTHAIVRAHGDRNDWTSVELPDGRTGYVASRYLRSPVDHRAVFQFRDGRWWLAAFVAGD